MSTRQEIPPAVVIATGYLAGAVPFSNIVSKAVRGVDLRRVGTGTVSGSGLFYEAGLKPLLIGGILDVTKGSIGPILAGRKRPRLAAVAGGAAVVGHNWSIFLQGAGGRGISPSMGAMAVNGWHGSLVLLAGVALGRSVRLTSVGALCSYLVLVPVMRNQGGRNKAFAAVAVVIPMLVKRIAGNEPAPPESRIRTWSTRLLFDQDTVPSLSWRQRKPGVD